MKRVFWIAILLVTVLALAACSNPNAPAGSSGGEGAAAPAAPAASAGEGVAEFHPAWPYLPPPTGHFNTLYRIAWPLGIYQDLMEPALFFTSGQTAPGFRWPANRGIGWMM
ncbi:MAG: hypothetical protein R3A44_08315 [Caldilineaceae bacterium]